jgi:hypothetical protein
MTSASGVIIPCFSSDVVESLPLQYRAIALHLAETGRVKIEDKKEKP